VVDHVSIDQVECSIVVAGQARDAELKTNLDELAGHVTASASGQILFRRSSNYKAHPSYSSSSALLIVN
jgi:hypothetical protein